LQTSFEYILAGIMIFMILAVVGINIFNVTTHTLARLEQLKEYRKAADILDSLLLSPGYPPDWWNYSKYPNPENISFIGLALQGSVGAYVLDARKLNRLNSSSNGYIPPTKMRSLLGLRRSYDFSLRIMPVFNVSISNVTGTFNITVRDLNGVGLPNANVTAFYVPRSLEPGVDYNCSYAVTDKDGRCTVSFDYNPEYGIVVCVSKVGVKVIASKPENPRLRIIGERVFEADYPLISYLEYKTASISGFAQREVAFRYVTIDSASYYVEFTLWS